MGQRIAAQAADAPALGQVHLDKITMLAAQAGERIERLDHACALGHHADHDQ